MDLFQATREHDLPPRWDGVPVEWEGWQPSLEPVFICPPPKGPVCTACASAKPQPRNRGTRLIPFGENVVQIGKGNLRPRVMKAGLVASRCPDCGHDTVWDHWTDEWWDLDPTDYEDDGSVAPGA